MVCQGDCSVAGNFTASNLVFDQASVTTLAVTDDGGATGGDGDGGGGGGDGGSGGGDDYADMPPLEGDPDDILDVLDMFSDEITPDSGKLKETGEEQEEEVKEKSPKHVLKRSASTTTTKSEYFHSASEGEEEEVKRKSPRRTPKHSPSPATQEEDPASVATVERLQKDSDDEEVKPGPKKGSPPPKYTTGVGKAAKTLMSLLTPKKAPCSRNSCSICNSFP
eukprot:Em1019g1a